jgi:D-arabinose 1-dehydrogenase-like Zn-dependent alcohol dehydrogenase
MALAGFGGLPRVPGHEIVGDVVAIGEGEGRWKEGDRVGGGWHGGHCFHCDSCTKGDFVTCPNHNINGYAINQSPYICVYNG